MLAAAGERAAALAEYRKGFVTFERLAAADPGNAEWQGDLFVSYEKMGDVLIAAGDREAALAEYRKSLVIAERLAAADSGNANWQRNLSVSHERIGGVLATAGDREAALAEYRKSLVIAERLAAADPGNARWQHDLAVSHEKIGDVVADAGDREAALAKYRKSLVIFERLAAADPSNTEWKRDLGVSYDKINEILRITSSSLLSNVIPEEIGYTSDMDVVTALKAVAVYYGLPRDAVDAIGDLAANAARETTGRAEGMPRPKWETDRQRGETPAAFIKRAYAAEISAGDLHKGIIHSKDPPLYRALFKWLAEPGNGLGYRHSDKEGME